MNFKGEKIEEIRKFCKFGFFQGRCLDSDKLDIL